MVQTRGQKARAAKVKPAPQTKPPRKASLQPHPNPSPLSNPPPAPSTTTTSANISTNSRKLVFPETGTIVRRAIDPDVQQRNLAGHRKFCNKVHKHHRPGYQPPHYTFNTTSDLTHQLAIGRLKKDAWKQEIGEIKGGWKNQDKFMPARQFSIRMGVGWNQWDGLLRRYRRVLRSEIRAGMAGKGKKGWELSRVWEGSALKGEQDLVVAPELAVKRGTWWT